MAKTILFTLALLSLHGSVNSAHSDNACDPDSAPCCQNCPANGVTQNECMAHCREVNRLKQLYVNQGETFCSRNRRRSLIPVCTQPHLCFFLDISSFLRVVFTHIYQKICLFIARDRPLSQVKRQKTSQAMKIVNSLKTIKLRDKNCRVIRRKGRIYVINKLNPRYKARQG